VGEAGSGVNQSLKRAHAVLKPLFDKNSLALTTRTAGHLNASQSKVNGLGEDDAAVLFEAAAKAK